LLESIYPVTGHGEYTFPSGRSLEKTMHSESVNKAIRRFDNGKFRSDVIEKQLAHQERNKVRGAYNHAEYLQERTQMMQWYADYLESLT
jgi:integrase